MDKPSYRLVFLCSYFNTVAVECDTVWGDANMYCRKSTLVFGEGMHYITQGLLRMLGSVEVM